MKTTIEIKEQVAKAYNENSEQIGTVTFEVAEQDGRKLHLIQSADVDAEYQRKGLYAAMLKAYAEIQFNGYDCFISIGRSDDAAMFWMKKAGLSEEIAELGIEKDQQERALFFNENLELVSNEYSPDYFDLFW